jgi:hypothetical protein
VDFLIIALSLRAADAVCALAATLLLPFARSGPVS